MSYLKSFNINRFKFSLSSCENKHVYKYPSSISWIQKAKNKKTKRKKNKGQTQGETEEDEDQEVSEPEGPVEEPPPKPEPPEKPDFDRIEQQVREKASRIRRKPGEAILVPELSASGNITANEQCPR